MKRRRGNQPGESSAAAQDAMLPSVKELLDELGLPLDVSRTQQIGSHVVDERFKREGQLAQLQLPARSRDEREHSADRQREQGASEQSRFARESGSEMRDRSSAPKQPALVGESKPSNGSKFCHICARKGARIELVWCKASLLDPEQSKCKKAYCRKCLDDYAALVAAQVESNNTELRSVDHSVAQNDSKW
eukprot:CAMPEP_0185832038 /NCGR_PEP_ID=MMETSP1353-20130828/1851_1 /TAXON_ID=1077150 /ORGANISM="Erythrolobus australicus, Strain CCMP3124" /LENGTH=190 /DNA_ID=CAMNT_0028530171 /DNA_START=50 /DNA_END=619 /DNA_ORIENTATION=+